MLEKTPRVTANVAELAAETGAGSTTVKVANETPGALLNDPWHVEPGCFWKGLALLLKESLC